MSIEALQLLISQMHGIDPDDHRDLERAMRFVRDSYIEVITFDEVANLQLRYPVVLQPIRDLQDAMIKCFMGKKWWDRKKRLFQQVRNELRVKKEREELKRKVAQLRRQRQEEEEEEGIERPMAWMKNRLPIVQTARSTLQAINSVRHNISERLPTIQGV